MELSQIQQVLIHFLKKYNLEREAILLISLMLSKSADGIRAFLCLCKEEQLQTQEEFLRLALEIMEVLPEEEQAGTPMDLRIKI